MFNFEKIVINSDLKALQEEKKKITDKLCSLKQTVNGKITLDELKQEKMYIKELSIIDEKINNKELEIKKASRIKAIIFVIVFTTLITSLSFYIKYFSKGYNDTENKNHNFSSENDKYVLKKTIC